MPRPTFGLNLSVTNIYQIGIISNHFNYAIHQSPCLERPRVNHL